MAHSGAYTRPTITVTRQILEDLLRAKESLDSYLDVDNMDDCSLPSSARFVSGPYLSSWVSSPLDVAIERMKCALDGRPYTPWREGEG